jgi:hypothetical protein
VFCGAVKSGASEAYNSPLACLCGAGALLAGEGDDDDDGDNNNNNNNNNNAFEKILC